MRELYGSRAAAVGVLAAIAESLGAEAVTIDGYPSDAALREASLGAGAELEAIPFSGTVKLLDAERLWRDFSPLLAERLGEAASSAIGVSSEADDLKVTAMTFELGGERWRAAGEEAVLASLFGRPGAEPLEGVPGELGELLRKALPFPLCLYGMNYI